MLSYLDPGTTSPLSASGKAMTAEFAQFDSNTLTIDMYPGGSGLGSWQTTDDPAVSDVYALTFDGATFKLARWRSGSETVLISKAYNAGPDSGS